MKQIKFINIQSQVILRCGMQQKVLGLLLMLELHMRFMMILQRVSHSSTHGLVQQLKVLVVIQHKMLDGKYFMALTGKLQEEHIIAEQQL